MTGPLEWLSQTPLENRKADKLIATAAPRVIRRLQSAERSVLREAAASDLAQRRSFVSAHFATLRSAAEQHIIAHIQSKIALIDPSLSSDARRAALQRLIAEQEAALAHVRQDIKQASRHARRALGTALNRRAAARRTWLLVRHAAEYKRCLALFGIAPGSSHVRRRAHSARAWIRVSKPRAIQRRPAPGRQN